MYIYSYISLIPTNISVYTFCSLFYSIACVCFWYNVRTIGLLGWFFFFFRRFFQQSWKLRIKRSVVWKDFESKSTECLEDDSECLDDEDNDDLLISIAISIIARSRNIPCWMSLDFAWKISSARCTKRHCISFEGYPCTPNCNFASVANDLAPRKLMFSLRVKVASIVIV